MSHTILLLTPPYKTGPLAPTGPRPPLTLLHLAGAARRAGWQPVIQDFLAARGDHADVRRLLDTVKPEVVAASALTATYPDALEVLRNAKALNPEIVTVLTGVHPTYMYREILEQHRQVVDYVVRDEGDEALVELLEALEAGRKPRMVAGLAFAEHREIMITRPQAPMEDPEVGPLAWDLVDWDAYDVSGHRIGSVLTARGGDDGDASGLEQAFRLGPWRPREPEKVVAEICLLRETYGVDWVRLADAHPTRDAERWAAILDGLIEAGFDGRLWLESPPEDVVRDAALLDRARRAGVLHVDLGTETSADPPDAEASETVREAIRLLRAQGIVTERRFVVGAPDETLERIEAVVDRALDLGCDLAHFLPLAPWPWTDDHWEAGRHLVVKDPRRFNHMDVVVRPEDMAVGEVDRAILAAYRRFHEGRVEQVAADADGVRRDYLLAVTHALLNSSFLAAKPGDLGALPERVAELLGEAGAGGDAAEADGEATRSGDDTPLPGGDDTPSGGGEVAA